MVRVKVCGVTREADLRAVEAAGADAVGVIADVPVETPREVSLDRAGALLGAAPPFLTTVLVTMPADAGAAVAAARAADPDVLQVHGELDPSALKRVREETGVRVVPVVSPGDPARAREVAAAAAAVLVDTPGTDGGGGTGRTHDWAATRDLAASLSVPVVLAGGLVPGNVGEAVRTVQPYGVDVASGVEREGGVKDHDAVAAFVRAARAGGDDGDGGGSGEPDGTAGDGEVSAR
jgi:phosphoribosylanthranilate isomerase